MEGMGWERGTGGVRHKDTLSSGVDTGEAMYRNSTRCGDWLRLQDRENEPVEILRVPAEIWLSTSVNYKGLV
jgi:hypothetical protein